MQSIIGLPLNERPTELGVIEPPSPIRDVNILFVKVYSCGRLDLPPLQGPCCAPDPGKELKSVTPSLGVSVNENPLDDTLVPACC